MVNLYEGWWCRLIVAISVVVLFGAGVFVLCKWAGLKVWHAALCVLFGFYLASSPLAPTINEIVAAFFTFVNGR